MSRFTVRKAVIPAAGLGTRFLPATKASPKEMLPLVDKPLIQYTVEEAVASGIEDIIVITGRGKRAIEDHFDRSVELEENLKGTGKSQVLHQIRQISNLANFCYVRQAEALGLGHAVLCAQHLIGDEPFAVILGDEIIDAHVPALAQLIYVYKNGVERSWECRTSRRPMSADTELSLRNTLRMASIGLKAWLKNHLLRMLPPRWPSSDGMCFPRKSFPF
jgi:UTP-glucose-1-phosphate uridylyltransferase